MEPQFIPDEITRANQHDVKIIWKDGHQSIYPARFLRLQCRCAECVEEMTGRHLLDPKSVPDDVKPMGLELVGNYGLQIQWSDGHSAGIYTFRALRSYSPT